MGHEYACVWISEQTRRAAVRMGVAESKHVATSKAARDRNAHSEVSEG